jgi:hypothetical protein
VFLLVNLVRRSSLILSVSLIQQEEVFTFTLPGQVPDFYASSSAPAPPLSGGIVLDGQPLTAVLAGAADVRDPKGAYTVYIILVCRSHQSVEKPAVWTVFRRYRAFKTLAEALKRRNISVPVPFPSKFMLFGTRDGEFLARRRQGLEAWLSSLLTTASASLFSFPEVQAFFVEHADDLPRGIDVAAYRAALADLEAEAVAAASGPGDDVLPPPAPPAAPEPPVKYHYAQVSLGSSSAAGGPTRAPAPALVPKPPANPRPVPPQAPTRVGAPPGVRAAVPRIGLESFELLKVIGKGSFGKVLLVRKREGGGLFAMKVLSKQNIVKRKQVEHTITERRVLSYTRHPFIIALHYAFQVCTRECAFEAYVMRPHPPLFTFYSDPR